MRSRTDADVVVVGAGPSGALTALLLARAGLTVIMVDRAVFPRAKACGDCLSAETGALLERNGLIDAVHALPHARLEGWRIFAPGGRHFAASFRDVKAIAVERRHFDHAIVAGAQAAGARLLECTKVLDLKRKDDTLEVSTCRADTGRASAAIRARFVVGADGLRSVIARRLGAIARPAVRRKFSLTLHIAAPLEFGSAGEMHTASGLCVGIAPLTAALDRWNVTIVADAARYGRMAATDQLSFIAHALRSTSAIGDRISESAFMPALDSVLASGPFDVPTHRIAFPGVALAGDAAGYFDPFTGQGVYQGMRAAELLAPALTTALDAGEAVPVLDRYEQQAGTLTRGSRRLQRLIDTVMDSPPLADRAIDRLARAPRAADALLAVTGDMAPVRRLLRPTVAFDFLFPRRS